MGEGQLNRNPAVIQPFRYGSLKFALEHKMPIYFFVMWGPQDSWPVASAMGGFSADIRYKVGKFDIEKECGGHEAALQSIESFATKLQDQMQKMVDELRNNSNGNKSVGEKKKE